MSSAWVLLLAVTFAAGGRSGGEEMVKVAPGTVRPVYLPDEKTPTLPVDGFALDRYPVTNADFLSFVKKHPRWRRDKVKRLFAGPEYLQHWSGATELGPLAPANAPVTRVSWFAARAYCKARGARLATELEWERAAQADSDDPRYNARILEWYSQPTPKVLGEVGRGEPNSLGLHDLHGLIWEWVDDFSNTLVTGDSRDGGDPDKVKFCGASAVSASDRMDYAAFMRVAFRSSLQGHFAVQNLGFRCARDL